LEDLLVEPVTVWPQRDVGGGLGEGGGGLGLGGGGPGDGSAHWRITGRFTGPVTGNVPVNGLLRQ